MFKTAVAIIILGIFAVITGDYLGKQYAYAQSADSRKMNEDLERTLHAIGVESQRQLKKDLAKNAKIRANFRLYLEDLRKKELEAQK